MDNFRVLMIGVWGIYNILRKDTQKKIEGWLFIIALILLNIWLELVK